VPAPHRAAGPPTILAPIDARSSGDGYSHSRLGAPGRRKGHTDDPQAKARDSTVLSRSRGCDRWAPCRAGRDDESVPSGSAAISLLNGDPAAEASLIGLDATPLGSGHAIRGIGRYVHGVIEALFREEPEWCLDHLGLLCLSGPAAAGCPTSKARATWTRSSPRFRSQDIGWAWAAVADRAALRHRQPAIWHQTDPASPISPLSMRRTLTTAYDLIPLHEPEVMARIRPHRRLAYRLYLRYLRRARMAVAISETTADDLVETLRIPRSRIRVVYPLVEPLAGPSRDRVAGESRVESRGAGPSFLFVGIPDPHKRPDLAIAAFARFWAGQHDGRLTFIGYQPEVIRRRLLHQAESLGIARAVQFADRVDDGTLARMYESGVLLSLSRREGFGLPPVEALLTGGRAVAVPGAIYDEVLGDAGVRAESDRPDSIAQAMLLACDTKPDPAAVERLRIRYSPRATSAALRKAYDEALGWNEASSDE